MQNNPILDWQTHPAFDQLDAEQIAPAVDALAAQVEAGVSALEAGAEPTWDGVAQPLYAILDLADRVWMLLAHVDNVQSTDAWQAAYAAALPKLSDIDTRIGQSRPIFDALCALRDRAEAEGLSEAQRRALAQSIRGAELTGVGLDDPERSRVAAISQELEALSHSFSQNVLGARKAWSHTVTDPASVAGMPAVWRARAAEAARDDGPPEQRSPDATAEAGPWRVTLDWPSAGPVYTHCQDRSLRERVRRASGALASAGEHDNTAVLQKILALRAEEAALLGFPSYVELSLARKMAGSAREIQDLLERLLDAARPADARDLAALDALAAERGAPEAGAMRPWDLTFWGERLKEERLGLDEEALRPWFPLEGVLAALFELIERLFEVRVVPADGEVPVWHPDVRFFRLEDPDGSPRASLYLDPYVRPGEKRGGAWMMGLVQRSRALAPAGRDVRLPVTFVNCNQTPPVDGVPSLMSFSEVQTLFHEFGHALQSTLTTQDICRVAGTSGVEWDAVELPSLFLESWCYHRPTLRCMARHHETGAPLPEAQIEALFASRRFMSAGGVVASVRWSLLDLEVHLDYTPGDDPFALERSVRARTDLLPPLPEDRYLCSFGHIFSGAYAVGYYSYLWAEVLSADAYAAFEDAGAPEAEAILGRRFRDTVLGLGGGRHPMQVFEDFRGRPPAPDALLRQKGLDATAPSP